MDDRAASGLQRFVDAQHDTYPVALREIRAGAKRSHWMWFIFPQLRGLGHSPMADYYGIADLAEARAYLAHPVLGARLEEITLAVLSPLDTDLDQLFGAIDALKFRSSMTLFARACEAEASTFSEALDRYCEGRPDRRTLELLLTR